MEDNDTDAHMALRIFTKEINNRTCKRLPNGKEAIDYIESLKAHEMPDLVLLDLKMPKVSGIEVLKHLKSNVSTAKMPVIIYTSSGQKSDMEEAYSSGANSFLIKPNDYQEMKKVLGTTYRYWLEYNRR